MTLLLTIVHQAEAHGTHHDIISGTPGVFPLGFQGPGIPRTQGSNFQIPPFHRSSGSLLFLAVFQFQRPMVAINLRQLPFARLPEPSSGLWHQIRSTTNYHGEMEHHQRHTPIP